MKKYIVAPFATDKETKETLIRLAANSDLSIANYQRKLIKYAGKKNIRL